MLSFLGVVRPLIVSFALNFSFDTCSLFFACLAHFVRAFSHTHDAYSLASTVLS